MTRIGFAYNQKPIADETIPAADTERTPVEDEPPSTSSIAATSSLSTTIGGTALDAYAEWDSPATIDAVANALSALGDVIRLEATPDFPQALRDARPDLVFNIAEGLNGPNRESHVPAICEFYGVPYSGSDPFTLALCLDKARTKEVLAYHDVPTAAFTVVREASEIARTARPRRGRGAAPFPLFVKPLHEGSSKGITEKNLCSTARELGEQVRYLLETYRQPVIIEEYLPGAEFTCAVLGNGSSAQVLPIVGMNFDSLPEGALPIYGFEAKWIWDVPERPLQIFECPANVPDDLRASIERVALHAYRVLGCRDWTRVDVRLDAAGTPHVIEVNPLPGILPDPADNSCFPKAARAAGLSYDELIQRCAMHAAERYGIALATPAEVA